VSGTGYRRILPNLWRIVWAEKPDLGGLLPLLALFSTVRAAGTERWYLANLCEL